jgi:hypothetical protein
MSDLWTRYAEALASAGLAERDVVLLIEQARKVVPLFSRTPLLPLACELLDEHAFAGLLDATVDAQAHGPSDAHARDVWRLLFVEGCPLDHIWAVFYHAFKDPESDPQDWVTVAPDVALANARRYVELRFPRVSGPWPGLGCQNALECVRARIEALAPRNTFPAAIGLQELCRARAVVSRRLRSQLDDATQTDAELRRRLDASTVHDQALLVDWAETRTRFECFDVARRWVNALDEALRQRRAVHDIGDDLFVAATEPVSTAIPARRPEPASPTDRRLPLHHLIEHWNAGFSPPWNEHATRVERLMEHRDWEDPLTWLESVVEVAVVEWDDDGNTRVRSPAKLGGQNCGVTGSILAVA